MTDVPSAVAGTIADLFGGPDSATDTVEQPAETVAEPPQETAPVIDLNPPLPDEYQELLEAPDFDEDEPAAQWEQPAEDEYVDPEDLARENARLKKQIAWETAQKTKANQRAWAAEAKKVAPLSRPETINATSRRAFIKAARAQHDQNYELLAPHIDQYATAKANLRAELEAEIRAELASAWGKPTVGGGQAPSPATGHTDDLERARASRNLAGVAKALIAGNKI